MMPSASSPRAARPKFETLDAMRGVAAIVVMLYHCRALLPGGRTFESGYLAVDLFFALSGFVIAHAYDARLADGIGVGRFVAIRLIRFLPMIWLGAAVAVAQALLLPQGDAPPLDEVLRSAAGAGVLLPVAIGTSPFAVGVNPPQWSMLAELVTNAVYALCFPRLRAPALIVGIVVSGLVLAAMVRAGGGIDHGWERGALGFAMVRATFSFLVGVALCRTRGWWQPSIPAVPSTLVLAAVALAMLLPTGPRFALIFAAGIAPALIALGARAPLTGWSQRVGHRLATLSYPLYAIHYPVYRGMQAAIEHGLPRAAGLAAMLALVPLCVAIGERVDAPIRRWMSGSPRAPRQVAVASRPA